MSLGWGLRGFIGGGPLGAMIPGAMVVMALCLLLRRTSTEDWPANGVAAAFGAVGVGFGGQMTYGQTIGLTLHDETAAWGLLGLTLKGAIWGLLGGAVIACGLQPPPLRRILAGSGALMLACFIGWKFINEPKLIYFSDPVNKPRVEIWAGLLLAALAFLFVVRSRVAWNFAWIACIGGGAGFGIGGWINALGRTSGIQTPVDWWKIMEFTFGYLFGAALGFACWKFQDQLAATPQGQPSWTSLLLLPFAPLIVAAEEGLGYRFTYTVAGAVLLPLAARHARFAWQTAISATCIAFSVDFLQSRPDWNQTLLWAAVAAISIALFWLVDRKRMELLWMLLFLTWFSTLDSHLKSWLPPFVWQSPKSWAHAHVEIVFTVLAILVTWLAMQMRATGSSAADRG
jgi:hypothetical protein